MKRSLTRRIEKERLRERNINEEENAKFCLMIGRVMRTVSYLENFVPLYDN